MLEFGGNYFECKDCCPQNQPPSSGLISRQLDQCYLRLEDMKAGFAEQSNTPAFQTGLMISS